jgi:hypothetical protein
VSSNSFFPTTEAEQAVWLTNFALKLPVHGPVCGIDAEEITGMTGEINYWVWILQPWHPAIQHYAKESTAYKLLMINGTGSDVLPLPRLMDFPAAPPAPLPGIQRRLFNLITRIKASPGYNESIGHDLGIIATPGTTEHPVPELTVTVELGTAGPRVRIDFKKHGHDGVWIETRTNGGGWAFLAIDTVKPYLDERPLAAGNTHETREYRMRWWDKSQAHGEWSAVHRAVLGGS